MSDVLPPTPAGAAQPACPGCGAPAIAGAAFCHKCGFPLGAAPPPPSPEPSAAAASPFDPASAAAPSPFDSAPGAAPSPATTLPGWGEPAQPPHHAAGPGRPSAQGAPQGPGAGPAQGWGQPQRPGAYASPYAPPAPAAGGRSRVVAALLAFFLGGLGAHKFYLGRYLLGALYLLFSWTFIPTLVSFVEFVLLLVMSDEKFEARYGHLTGSGAAPVLIVLGAGFLGVMVLGILAAIAIPNFIRYQLRAKAAEVPALLASLDAAQVARREAGESYLVFADGLPAGQDVGAATLAWSAEDLALAQDLGWSPGEATHARYAADGQEDGSGNQALALCAVTDLDGDGELAAWVVFRPALAEDGSLVVPPPEAPCPAAVALKDGASVGYDPVVPPGTVVRLSPDGVF